MNNFKIKEKNKLEGFRLYLISKAKISESTAGDYCKRIKKICEEENIYYEDLCKNIDKYVFDHCDGDKKELGSRSHNSYRGALKQLSMFLKSYSTRSNYEIHLTKIDDDFCVLSLKDKNDNTIGSLPINIKNYSKENRLYQVADKIMNICLPIIIKNNPERLFDFLETEGFSIKFDNEGTNDDTFIE